MQQCYICNMILHRFNNIFTIATMLLILGFISSCKKDKDNPKNPNNKKDHGFITTLELNFTNQNDTLEKRSFVFTDNDGPGGLPPSRWDTIRLDANKTWSCEIKMYDATDGNKDITYQIKEDAKNHIFCFNPSNEIANNLIINRTDSDGKYEIGLSSNWITQSTSKGSVQIILKHQVRTKDGTCNPGSTDIELLFRTEIQ
jgi:hypothetical protein